MKHIKFWIAILIGFAITSCGQAEKQSALETDENGVAILSDEQVEEIVKRSY
ncbi:hypothetical protein [Eudoraea adriatica]|uniref:hypothetical protein n=1 Tax=Eudoraea adriatica TaxID=446681 RepID=UPI0003A9D4C9|nr:hypothetical protein [Eudoraea adriatica]